MKEPFPLPGAGRAVVAVPAPGEGHGWWAGSSSAALDDDGTFVIAYRVRTGERGRGSTVVARSENGERFTTVATLEQARFGAQSMERPALVRTDEGRWRLYVCPASPAPSKHWWIEVLEADDPADLATAEARTVFPGDERTGVKDPLVQRTADGDWQAWICCHPLDVADEEDRMTTAYATSADGLEWEWHGTVLAPRPGRWDARGARVTAVLPDGRELVRESAAGSSYLSSEDPRSHFGLGTAGSVSEVVVRWPDGQETIIQDVAANQILTVEPPG